MLACLPSQRCSARVIQETNESTSASLAPTYQNTSYSTFRLLPGVYLGECFSYFYTAQKLLLPWVTLFSFLGLFNRDNKYLSTGIYLRVSGLLWLMSEYMLTDVLSLCYCYYRLSVPYQRCLGPECFRFLILSDIGIFAGT